MTPRLPTATPDQIIKVLKRIGYYIDHQTGSHIILKHKEKGMVLVPFHRKELKRGTLKSILRMAGISTDDLIRYL